MTMSPPFASHLNFLDPQFDEQGNPWAPRRYKQLVRECWYISNHIHTSYEDVLKMSPTERLEIITLISEELKARKEAMDEALSRARR